MIIRLFNMSLRLGSLAAKLILTLYMGRYFGLSDIGTYGLVAAYVAIAIPLLGFRFDYCVTRDIVGTEPYETARMMRDQAVFYGINYLAMVIIVLGLAGLILPNLSLELVILTLLLAVLESLATITSSNMISLNRPILSNFLFFIRAALWVLPVIVVGLLDESFRTDSTVFSWWLVGVTASLMMTAAIWRHLPWRQVLRTPVNWAWIGEGVHKSVFIWIGAVGLAAAVNIDRFFIEFFLGRDFVGIVSFYGSFVIAIPSLLASGIFAFTYPKLMLFHKNKDKEKFFIEAKMMTIQGAAASGAIAAAVGIIVPYLGDIFGRPEFADHAPTLWLMLFAVWLRSSTESLYYVMYARHQDRDVWVGNLLLLVTACAANAILVPTVGLHGIGISAVISSIILCIWRVSRVRQYQEA